MDFYISSYLYIFLVSCQELTEDVKSGSAFHDDNFLSKNGHPKELFLSSDANAVVEHTKKVLVIEDGEVVHLKVFIFQWFQNFRTYFCQETCTIKRKNLICMELI